MNGPAAGHVSFSCVICFWLAAPYSCFLRNALPATFSCEDNVDPVAILIRIAIIRKDQQLFSTLRVSAGSLPFAVTVNFLTLIKYSIHSSPPPKTNREKICRHHRQHRRGHSWLRDLVDRPFSSSASFGASGRRQACASRQVRTSGVHSNGSIPKNSDSDRVPFCQPQWKRFVR